jgi:hypothetical protein
MLSGDLPGLGKGATMEPARCTSSVPAAGEKSGDGSRMHPKVSAAMLALAVVACAGKPANAVEGGVSFWIPGFFGSLAAAPLVPGFSYANIYYHTSVKAGGDVAFARQVTRGNLTANFSGNLNANLNADADVYFAVPSYTFAQPFLGGQATIAVAVPYGRSRGSVDATLTGNLGLGGPGFTLSGGRTDDITGFGDAAPMFNVRWNNGVHNTMTYVTGNLTIGRYDPTRLANLGIGHQAINAGGGYTYFDPDTGREFSAVLGFTYNFENEHTQYQGGVDMNLDWGASQFLTKQLQVGLVGYAYNQISCDSGARNRLGCFEARVFGAGPQIGYIIPMGNLQGYVNLKGYKEFNAEHRASGWNAWLTFSISPAARPSTPPKPRIAK